MTYLYRKSVDDGLRNTYIDPDADGMSEVSSVQGEDNEEAGAFLRQPCNIERMEHAADVYTRKAHELMHTRDPSSLDRDLMIKVVRIKSQRFYGCLTLPFNLIFFLLFVTSVCLHEDISFVYAVESTMRSVLTKNVEEVESIEHVWDWMSDEFFPTVFFQKDIQGNTLEDKSKWSRVLTYNYLMGPVRLEQIRSPTMPCKSVLPESKDDTEHPLEEMLGEMICFPMAEPETGEAFGLDPFNFSISEPSHSDYAGGNVTLQEREAYYSSAFVPVQGRRLRIGRSEYSMYLPQSKKSKPAVALFYQNTKQELVYEHLNYLKAREWLDAQTKQVKISALFFNADVGRPRLHHFELLMSFSRGGGIFTTVSFETIFLEIWGASNSIIADGGWLCFLMIKLFLEFRMLRNKWRIGEFRKTITTPFTMMQWFLIGIGMLYALTKLYDAVFMRQAVIDRFNEVVDQQVNDVPPETSVFGEDFHAVALQMVSFATTFRFMTACYLILLFFSFFAAFKYQPRLAVVIATLDKCFIDIIHFAIVLAPTFAGFAISGMFIFGRRIGEFSTPSGSFFTCFKIMMEGEYDWPLLSQEHFWTTAVWTAAFMVMLVILMLNLVLAIVLDVYAGVRRGSGQSESVWLTMKSILLQVWNHRDWIPQQELIERLKQLDKWITQEVLMKKISKMSPAQTRILLDATKLQSEVEASEGAHQTKEAMKMALAEKLIIDKVNETLKELNEGTTSVGSSAPSQQGWLGSIAQKMATQNHRMLNLQWHLQKLQWQWQAMEAVHGKGVTFNQEKNI